MNASQLLEQLPPGGTGETHGHKLSQLGGDFRPKLLEGYIAGCPQNAKRLGEG